MKISSDIQVTFCIECNRVEAINLLAGLNDALELRGGQRVDEIQAGVPVAVDKRVMQAMERLVNLPITTEAKIPEPAKAEEPKQAPPTTLKEIEDRKEAKKAKPFGPVKAVK
jgi:hypothetical protein